MQRVSHAHAGAGVGNILGRQTVTKSIAGGIFVCAAEQKQRAYWHYHMRSWFTFLGARVLPGRVVGDYVECFSCKSTYDPRIVGSTHPALRVAETG
ncbi:MAG: hypothetical protein WAL25_05700 [Acidimicrobiia bacterium]